MEYAGTAVKVITSAETARTSNKTTDGHMVGHGRIRKAARQATMPANDGLHALLDRTLCVVGHTRVEGELNGPQKPRSRRAQGSAQTPGYEA